MRFSERNTSKHVTRTLVVATAIVTTTLTCGTGRAQQAAPAEEAAPAQEAESIAPPAAVADAAVPIDEIPIDDAATRELAERLEAELSPDKEELVAVSRDIGLPLIASLRHGLEQARVDQRRRRMEQARVRMLDIAEQLASERKQCLATMDGELEKAADQFAEAPDLCQRQQVAIVRAYRGRLQSLKGQEDLRRDKAETTGGLLVDLRTTSVMLDRKISLTSVDPILGGPSATLPEYSWLEETEQEEEAPSPSDLQVDTDSLAEAMQSIQQLREP